MPLSQRFDRAITACPDIRCDDGRMVRTSGRAEIMNKTVMVQVRTARYSRFYRTCRRTPQAIDTLHSWAATVSLFRSTEPLCRDGHAPVSI
jgi:hypothetical protein